MLYEESILLASLPLASGSISGPQDQIASLAGRSAFAIAGVARLTRTRLTFSRRSGAVAISRVRFRDLMRTNSQMVMNADSCIFSSLVQQVLT